LILKEHTVKPLDKTVKSELERLLEKIRRRQTVS